MSIANKTFQPILTITIKTTTELPSYRFVDFLGKTCDENQKALGVTVGKWKSGGYAGIIVLGTALVEASGTISVGDKVTSDSQGKAKVATTGAEVNGRALGSAGPGDLVRILLVP
ncbi:MAG: DUF2190 family protein [Ignavibacteria bacterium]|nr:DUF2190 family protein [Ignavibacteria bacterium]